MTADAASPAIPHPRLELIARLTADLAPPIELGETSAGLRRIIPILGGTVDGPLLWGEILPGGADWNTWNDREQTGSLAAQYAIRTRDGVVIGVTNTGRHTIPEPGEPIFTTPVLEAPSGAYDWLNHVALVGSLRPRGEGGTGVFLEFWRAIVAREHPTHPAEREQ